MRKYFIVFLGLMVGYSLSAQDKLNIKFGKISAADFEVSSPLIDSNVNAVVLADIGRSEFVGNDHGWFSLVFKKHKRIKILNKKGFEAAEIAVYLYSAGNETEKLQQVNGQTYNLENGTVAVTKLDTKSIFEEKSGKNFVKKKFTFPAVKEGSIIEFTYTITSDFIFNLQPWSFQGEYPCLWSEYDVGLPDFFNYVFLSQGYLNFDIKKNEERFSTYSVIFSGGSSSRDRTYTINTIVHDIKWVIKNAPALKAESFTSTINNHIAKIEFQLSEYRFPNQPVENIMASWPKVTEKLLEREDFGQAYTRANNWMDDELKTILQGCITEEEKARKIFEFVRDHFTCTTDYGIYLGNQTSLKDIFKRKSGSVGEINLLLLAMLRHGSIFSDPVLLGLRSRGFVHPIYPLMDRFNYLICEVKLDGKTVYLDASKPYLGFNQLPASCYNGVAWAIRKDNPSAILLNADSLRETKNTYVILTNDDENGLGGSFSSRLGLQESYRIREKMANTSLATFTKEISRRFVTEIKLENLWIDSLKLYDEPVTVKYEFKFKTDEDMIYFNPLLGEGISKNPFTSANRLYPVEMPFATNELYVLSMEIPKGYAVEEIPKSVRYNLNEDEGLFEYRCSKSDGLIQLRMKVVINKANFLQEDYQYLRDFFSFIIQKQSEQIVFKKVK